MLARATAALLAGSPAAAGSAKLSADEAVGPTGAGSITVNVAPLGSNCTSISLTSVAWTNVALTSLSSGAVYDLDPAFS